MKFTTNIPEQVAEDFDSITHWRANNIYYLDSAASSQVPVQVRAAIQDYHRHHHANVHRGNHSLSNQSTQLFEEARSTAATFINAPDTRNIIFTSGTTASINLASAAIEHTFNEGDRILISAMEHHANLVPWQQLAHRKKLKLDIIPIHKQGDALGCIDIEAFTSMLDTDVKMIAITHISNVLGTITPIKAITQLAHSYGASVLVDGAQAVAHIEVDVQAIGADFYTFSAHKMFGPTGIGILFATDKQLDRMHPPTFGGEMIRTVSFNHSTWAEPPSKFEPGTPNISGAIGLAAACNYLMQQNRALLLQYEQELTAFALNRLQSIPHIKIIRPKPPNPTSSVISFIIQGTTPSDLGTLLDQSGITLRVGHHCAMPLMDYLGLQGTVRVSLTFYNTMEDIEKLVQGLEKALSILQP